MTPDALREVIRDIVREVIREVVIEEMALGSVAPATATRPATPRTPAARPTGPATPPSHAAGVHVARGALTERHLRALGDARVVHIGGTVVITPLARDWARAKGIDIIRIDG